MMSAFSQKLITAQQQNNSWLCVGLDPDPDRMPQALADRGTAGLSDFCAGIIQATSDIACAYKPNLAFFLAHGAAGISALEQTLAAVPTYIPVILDAKLGDIGSTQRMYGRAAFTAFNADALTISPYVGEDAVLPLLEEYPGRGIFLLARTSNPDARRFQDHPGSSPYLYEEVVRTAGKWADDFPASTVGVVVGATYAGEIESIRVTTARIPFLIPGIGSQGGVLDAAVRFGVTSEGLGPLINVSRGINYASSGEDFASAARKAAIEYRQSINQLRQ